jgi:release factor glutamine methyltransferase
MLLAAEAPPDVSENSTGQSVESARRDLAARLKSASIDSPELDARMLVAAVLHLELTGLIASANRPLSADDAGRLEQLVRRRLAGEPVARILGAREFWGLPFRLSPATLVPRPDTETVVELALDIMLAKGDRNRAWRIADFGTGSGAILLALLHELPGTFGLGTDISVAALRMARGNAGELGLGSRAGFVACNYGAPLTGPFDLIVSNPPYVRSAEIAGLAPEVRDYDPLPALDGGADGLEAYRALIPQAAQLLAPGGALVLEIGQGQRGDIGRLLTAAGFIGEHRAKADLAGVTRAIAGRKMSP